ncbi:hypothetical protein CY34DRAFT_18407 [Suillus luteus UH-Slu-Lm8-n1]|uniref:Uncharacterized protein n=1 Tax=Suillus luteus UH-Slu-Lm8-n1 TaxID=930992 RepID=A0A0D0AGM4_9AGAM|nr:hypothetical protein CY34DRAFT_18407 [Suillus luteus UH-Slu-Lm8-n1]
MAEDISEQGLAWMADVLVAAVSPQYPDKLALLAAAHVEDRLRRATELFLKQSSIQAVSKKIASAVDESFSRQQKECFLCPHLLPYPFGPGCVVNTFLPLTLGALITTFDSPGVAPFPAFGSSPWPYLITYVLSVISQPPEPRTNPRHYLQSSGWLLIVASRVTRGQSNTSDFVVFIIYYAQLYFPIRT